jgi:hypothetical protein
MWLDLISISLTLLTNSYTSMLAYKGPNAERTRFNAVGGYSAFLSPGVFDA